MVTFFIECAPQSTSATSAPCENLVNRWWIRSIKSVFSNAYKNAASISCLITMSSKNVDVFLFVSFIWSVLVWLGSKLNSDILWSWQWLAITKNVVLLLMNRLWSTWVSRQLNQLIHGLGLAVEVSFSYVSLTTSRIKPAPRIWKV